MRISTLFLFAAVMLSGGSPARAADWIAVPELKFTQRLAITVENPSDVDTDSALAHIRLADLAAKLPDAKNGQIAVADSAPPNPQPKRDRANEYFIPFQVNHGVLTFAVPLASREKKTLFIYTSPKPLNMPGFPMKTGWDNRFAYRSFENNLMGFRLETGPGANTTGMAIDLFGKTAKGKGIRLGEIYESGHDSYHKLQYWGIDCLKLGSSPGVGGLYVIVGNQMGRPDAPNILVDCPHSGPLETVVRATSPVEVGGKKFNLTRTLTLWADDRGIDDVVELKGDSLDGAQIGVGMRNLPNEKWVEQPSQGYALNHGDNNQPNYKSVGFGAAFDPASYVKTIDLNDSTNGGHVYVLNGTKQGDALVSHHHLAAIWDGDGQINNPGDFEKYLQKWAKLLNHPTKVELSDRAEARP